MGIPESFFQNNRLTDPDDIDALLELAEMTRGLIAQRDHAGLERLAGYAAENGLCEAFSWIMGLVQEELEGDSCRLESFSCDLGESIGAFDAILGALEMDWTALRSDAVKVFDANGEVRSFCNIFTYRTRYPNIFAVSCESFDTLDNDHIRYKLLFVRDPAAPGDILRPCLPERQRRICPKRKRAAA